MKKKLLVPLYFLAATAAAHCQGLTITIPQHLDTAGISPSEWQSVEKSVSFTLPFTGNASDTLVVEMGTVTGNYDLFTREFPLSSTGSFSDGASLEFNNGLHVGLGSFTGLSEFHVRAFLRSAGVSSATILSD